MAAPQAASPSWRQAPSASPMVLWALQQPSGEGMKSCLLVSAYVPHPSDKDVDITSACIG